VSAAAWLGLWFIVTCALVVLLWLTARPGTWGVPAPDRIELPPVMPGFSKTRIAGADDAIAEAALRRRAPGGTERKEAIMAEVQAAQRLWRPRP